MSSSRFRRCHSGKNAEIAGTASRAGVLDVAHSPQLTFALHSGGRGNPLPFDSLSRQVVDTQRITVLVKTPPPHARLLHAHRSLTDPTGWL